jgi:hypothetical protein
VKIRIAFAVLSLIPPLVSCHRSWPPNVAARWDGGEIDLTNIERHLADSLEATESGEDLVRRYRETAEEFCVRDMLLREDADESDVRFQVSDTELARRQLTVNAWVTNRINPTVTVSIEEVDAYYAANPEHFHRLERRFVDHIFRRADDQADRETAQGILSEARTRFLDGESFRELAIEYSESEIRDLGESLGWVSQGTLEENAERIVFSLGLGEVSSPVPVRGGLAVFLVTQITPAKDFPVEDVRHQIAQQLRQEKLRERLDTIAEEAELPGDAVVVSEQDFFDALQSSNPGAVLYSDASLSVTTEDWRARRIGGTAESQRTQYVAFLQLQRAYHFAVADGFLAEPGQQEYLEAILDTTLDDRRVNLIARELMIDAATSDPQTLESWYEVNRERYQSQIELLVNLVVVKPTGRVEDQVNALRAIASNYSGETLEQSVESIPDATVSSSWVGIAALDAYHPNIKTSLLALDPPDCSPVFNIRNALNLFCIEDRKDPRQLSFEEAHDSVVSDFIATNEQELYAEIRTAILDRADFEFNETSVREILHAPAKAQD